MKARYLGMIGLLAASLAAAPASAASFVFNFGNTAGQASANLLDGTDGNIRNYSVTSSGQTLGVAVSGWSIISNTVRAAWLGAYTDGGLGVTNSAEGNGSNNRHTIDNSGQYDFVLLKFDRAVTLDMINYNSISGGDTDATVGRASVFSAWNATSTLKDKPVATLDGLFASSISSNGPASDNSRVSGFGTAKGNLWLIAALRPTNTTNDSFKLLTITASAQPVLPQAPEPQTWMTMIVGFGAIGSLLRRKRAVRGAGQPAAI